MVEVIALLLATLREASHDSPSTGSGQRAQPARDSFPPGECLDTMTSPYATLSAPPGDRR